MSSLFKDPCFYSMDPISKMVEPFTSPIFEVAQNSPKTYTIPFDALRSRLVGDYRKDRDAGDLRGSSYHEIDARQLLIDFTDVKNTINDQLDTAHFFYYTSMWSIETSHEKMEFALDDDCQSGYGDLVLSLNEDIFKQDMVKKHFTERVRLAIEQTFATKSQIKTLLEHLSLTKRDIDKNLSSKRDLSLHVCELITSDKWRIRSSTVLADLGDAFSSVLNAEQGWGLKLTDLIHFKILTHSANPLYSFPRTKE